MGLVLACKPASRGVYVRQHFSFLGVGKAGGGQAGVRTTRGKSDRVGSQGGRRKRGPWWNEEPASRIARASVGNSPPKVARAAVLSRQGRVED